MTNYMLVVYEEEMGYSIKKQNLYFDENQCIYCNWRCPMGFLFA